MGQSRAPSPQSRLNSIIPLKREFGNVFESPLLQRLRIALPPSTSIADIQRTAHESNFLVTDEREMGNRIHRALPIISLHNICLEAGASAHQQHNGDLRFLQHLLLRERE